ncbi:hypothetical protein AB0L40_24470 [Patulibacter sp. NPDC049589]|uniref:hypothetical protein n=1 Tax=Patulibacter sp. NPDC049589 TaxID=3154731 RepID=UPI00341EB419
MSPRIAAPTRRHAASAVVVLAALTAAAPATAAGAAGPGAAGSVTVEQPLQTAIGRPVVVAAVGNRQTVMAVQSSEGAADHPVTLSTVKDGAATPVASLPGVALSGLTQLEVGTAKDGVPVAVVATRRPDGTTQLRLVRLDTGAIRTISSTRQGLVVGGVGIDAGRYYYTLHPAKTTGTRTSSLWRATLTGTSIGRATRVRTSRRGEAWADVLADRDRVAVETVRSVHDGGVFAREEWAFGTPRGTWRRAGLTYASDGGYLHVAAAGFTQARDALVTVADRDDGGPMVTRTPIAGGSTVTRRLGTDPQDTYLSPAYDPATGRLLTRGADATGIATIGWTGVLFP